MFFLKKHHGKKIIKGALLTAGLFVLLASLGLGAYVLFEKKYSEKIYPGIVIGSVDLGGKDFGQAQNILNKKINELNKNGFAFLYQDKSAKIYPTISSVEGSLAFEIINFDTEKTINSLLKIGRDDTPVGNLGKKIMLFTKNKSYNIDFSLNKEEVYKILKNKFSKFEIEAENAQLRYQDGDFSVSEEKLGNEINYQAGIDRLKENIAKLKNSEIKLESSIKKPEIYKNQTNGLSEKAKKVADNTPLRIFFKNDDFTEYYKQNMEWYVGKEDLASWLTFKKDYYQGDEKIRIGLKEEEVKKYFSENIEPEIKIEPQNAKFEIKDGRVSEFQASKDGLEVNFEASFNLLENKFIGEGEKNIILAISELKSEIKTQDANDMGIKEIVGTGHSSFSGSPQNRRHNISVGASSLNGLIIEPGEEFSLIEALGDIDAENDYLPELVIKGNETIPEYGGGLCQIGTTLFRTVIQSGLPVTMRRNHSYRVSYYEPAGTDATIYDPWPDFRFKNDTGNNILIQSRIEGDDIYFDFWGKEDGREVEITEPTIYNIVKPPPTKYVETLNLEPGVEKCTESAHNGADAYFDYTVKYSEERVEEKRFNSHYIPWQEVCLIGVEELSQDKEETATSTEEEI